MDSAQPQEFSSDGDDPRLARFKEVLTSSPTLYPIAHDVDADLVRFIPLSESEYDAASFLDARMQPPDSSGGWCPWDMVRSAAAGLPERCHFIFHISHVGSTLVSRLLGLHPDLFSVREPAILRTLADMHLALDQPGSTWSRTEFDGRLGVYLALWSRTFGRGQMPVIKATSFVSEMSAQMMARVAGSRSIFMYVPPTTFLRALLDGAIGDITGAAAKRLLRLHRRLSGEYWRLEEFSVGECVAMCWLSEMLALHETAARFPERVLWIDFDRFLNSPTSGLVDAMRHLGTCDPDRMVGGILSGPTMGQYAKAPGQKYDAQLRDRLLLRSEQRHMAEVRKGIDWLTRAAQHTIVRELLEATSQRCPTG